MFLVNVAFANSRFAVSDGKELIVNENGWLEVEGASQDVIQMLVNIGFKELKNKPIEKSEDQIVEKEEKPKRRYNRQKKQ